MEFGGLTLENWQVAHFRVLGNDKFALYGTSILEPAREFAPANIARRCSDGLSWLCAHQRGEF